MEKQTEPLLTVDTRGTVCGDETCPRYGKPEVVVTLWASPDGPQLGQASCCSNPPDVETIKRLLVEGRA
jgi:hypothetical protein